MAIMHRGLCLVMIVLLNISSSSCFLSPGLARLAAQGTPTQSHARLARRSCVAMGRRAAAVCGLRAQAADGGVVRAPGEEWALTNDQCDLLELPRGTKMVLTQPDP